MLREHLESQGQEVPDADALFGNKYDAFEAEHQRRAKTLYEGDEIIVQRLRKERLEEIAREKQKAVQTTSTQRTIEPGDQAGFKNSNAMLIDPATFRPEQPQFYDPKAKRREQIKKARKDFAVKNEETAFEKPDEITLSPREEDLKMRL